MADFFVIISGVVFLALLISISKVSAKISHQTAVLAIFAERIEHIDKQLQTINRRLKQNDFLTDRERKDEEMMHETMAYTHDEKGNPI
ncbi:MAG: hypothetical protein Q8J99_00660 [Sulfuritalea sp.]|nr:hypothetical protein [Sulfuritalea sp.]